MADLACLGVYHLHVWGLLVVSRAVEPDDVLLAVDGTLHPHLDGQRAKVGLDLPAVRLSKFPDVGELSLDQRPGDVRLHA